MGYTGIAYYRLKIYLPNGNFSYSYIISLAADSKGMLTLYPSPTKADVVLSVGDPSLINTTVSVINNSGVVVKKVLLTGLQQQVQLGGLPAGIYYFRFVGGKVLKVTKE